MSYRLKPPRKNRKKHLHRWFMSWGRKIQGSPKKKSLPIFHRTNFLDWDGVHYKFDRVKHSDGSERTEIANDYVDRVEPHSFVEHKWDKAYHLISKKMCMERCLLNMGFCDKESWYINIYESREYGDQLSSIALYDGTDYDKLVEIVMYHPAWQFRPFINMYMSLEYEDIESELETFGRWDLKDVKKSLIDFNGKEPDLSEKMRLIYSDENYKYPRGCVTLSKENGMYEILDGVTRIAVSNKDKVSVFVGRKQKHSRHDKKEGAIYGEEKMIKDKFHGC